MKRNIGIIVSTLAIALVFTTGCNAGGANIRLEGIISGPMTMDGKTIQGLPSEKIDLLLEVSSREIAVKYNADGAILTLSPSGATIEIKDGGILINGIKPEQIKVQWATTQQD